MIAKDASGTAAEAETDAMKPAVSSYNNNLNAVVDDLVREAEERGGQLVARSLDGFETYVYAESYAEIYRLLEDRKIRPHEAVVSRVPHTDEAVLF